MKRTNGYDVKVIDLNNNTIHTERFYGNVYAYKAYRTCVDFLEIFCKDDANMIVSLIDNDNNVVLAERTI